MTAIHRTSNNETADKALFITRQQACARYAVSLRTIDNLLADGVIPSVSLGRRLKRIPVSRADEALMKFQTGGLQQ